jgi:Uma2 family endonuclease
MVAVRNSLPTRITVDEFLVWNSGDRSGRLWQLVDGEPVAMAPGSQNHGALQGEIGSLIRNHLRATRPSCRMIVTPGIISHLGSKRNFRIPGLGVTCSQAAAELAVPDPILLIEILSPSNETETWRNIWAYTTIPTVTEILAVRSTWIEAELLRRLPDGYWPKQAEVIRAGNTLTLASIGLSVELDAFYETSSLRA